MKGFTCCKACTSFETWCSQHNSETCICLHFLLVLERQLRREWCQGDCKRKNKWHCKNANANDWKHWKTAGWWRCIFVQHVGYIFINNKIGFTDRTASRFLNYNYLHWQLLITSDDYDVAIVTSGITEINNTCWAMILHLFEIFSWNIKW